MCSFSLQTLLSVSLLIGLSVPAEAVPAPVLTDNMYSGTSTIKKTRRPQKQADQQKQTNVKKKKQKRVVKKAATITTSNAHTVPSLAWRELSID
jgi:hypothetical protein